ncbi:type II toxin-antitoxin system RelE/ParE family toxin [Novosphingobium sp.]|uniref:type II toxin-antitoxin system RelE/ParE family toxin n=1 Tax=Novosphingobium sp. TaxID=1874826 RepID=UPI0038B97349
MTAVSYSPLAVDDLRDITVYIAADNPHRAFSFVEELRDKAERIANQPLAYPARDELVPGLRSASHGRYLLYYRMVEDGIRIERVLHSARDQGSTLSGD